MSDNPAARGWETRRARYCNCNRNMFSLVLHCWGTTTVTSSVAPSMITWSVPAFSVLPSCLVEVSAAILARLRSSSSCRCFGFCRESGRRVWTHVCFILLVQTRWWNSTQAGSLDSIWIIFNDNAQKATLNTYWNICEYCPDHADCLQLEGDQTEPSDGSHTVVSFIFSALQVLA